MIKTIIKDYKNPQNPEARVRIGRFAGFVGIFANILLFIVVFSIPDKILLINFSFELINFILVIYILNKYIKNINKIIYTIFLTLSRFFVLNRFFI